MFDFLLLGKAADKGIISTQQKDELIAFFQAQSDEAPRVARDEAPRFFRSFNDLFIGLGVVLLGFALSYATELIPKSDEIVLFVATLGCAGLFWLMAEWITRIRRINFPSIIISLFFAMFFISAMKLGWEQLFLSDAGLFSNRSKDIPFGVLAITAVSTAAIGGFFWRFKLPFSILLVAAGMAATVFTLLGVILGGEILEPLVRWILLLIGLALFAAAMYFDTQDPLRTQRTSDHGFWLHLLAAPIITHSVLWTYLQPLMAPESSPQPMANVMVLIVLAMFVVFSLIALIIDRRALLISSLGYASTAIGYIIYKFNIEGSLALVLTLILIAALILTLGTGWYRLRGALFKVLPDLSFFNKLPPLKT